MLCFALPLDEGLDDPTGVRPAIDVVTEHDDRRVVLEREHPKELLELVGAPVDIADREDRHSRRIAELREL